MIRKILDATYQHATLKKILVFLLLDLVLMLGLMPFMGGKIAALSDGMQVIDLQIPTYAAQTALDMVAAYGDDARKLYKQVELTADTIYPLVYGMTYALLLAFLFKGNLPGSPKWKYLLPLVPLIGMLFDFGENIGIVTMLSQFPDQPFLLAWITAKFSLLKWIFAFASIILITLGLIGKFFK